jgi:hypothetical protein
MESLLFDDWRELTPGEQDTSLFTPMPLLMGGGACEDTAASDLRFLDALLPQLADAGGDHAGWAGARGEASSGDDAGAPHASHAHDSGRPATVQDEDAEADEAAESTHACLDSHHPPGCTRCAPPPCADDAALYFLRGSRGALTRAPRACSERRTDTRRDAPLLRLFGPRR